MTSLEFIYKKEFVEIDRENKNIKYSVFSLGDEISISFNNNQKTLYIYDCVNTEPEIHDLDKYDYIIINNYIHYTIDEMINIYKGFVTNKRELDLSKKLYFNFEEKMSLEKLKDNLTDSWRLQVLGNIYSYAQKQLEDKSNNQIANNNDNQQINNNHNVNQNEEKQENKNV